MTHRLVVDTNTLISATFWDGQPKLIIELAKAGKVTVVTTVELAHEFETVLSYDKFLIHFKRIKRSAADVLQEYRQMTAMVSSVDIPKGAVRDDADRIVLAAAVGGNAAWIISGDRDLVDLGAYQAVKILTASQFLDFIQSEDI